MLILSALNPSWLIIKTRLLQTEKNKWLLKKDLPFKNYVLLFIHRLINCIYNESLDV
jgi:hypothetical protein